MKRIVVLGSTGSIGRSTLEVVKSLGSDYQIWGLAARSSLELLAAQAREFQPHVLAIPSTNDREIIRRHLNGHFVELACGDDALVDLVCDPRVDVVVNALVGGVGLKATLAALSSGKTVALANKESIVMAGRLVMEAVTAYGGALIPVDSEHSAVHQCLRGEDPSRIHRLLLTASGGPFLRRSAESFESITPEEALCHPNWSMGPKITIDSATMMNKGLEIIEAHYLFGLAWDKIHVVIHPQSVVHSLVEFIDGSLKAQLSLPDMRIPIQYAITYPDRLPAEYVSTDLTKVKSLNFEAPDFDRFPCLRLAYQALERGEGYPAVLSAANEIAVQAFLDKRLAFQRIPELIAATISAFQPPDNLDLNSLLQVDAWAKAWCSQRI